MSIHDLSHVPDRALARSLVAIAEREREEKRALLAHFDEAVARGLVLPDDLRELAAEIRREFGS